MAGCGRLMARILWQEQGVRQIDHGPRLASVSKPSCHRDKELAIVLCRLAHIHEAAGLPSDELSQDWVVPSLRRPSADQFSGTTSYVCERSLSETGQRFGNTRSRRSRTKQDRLGPSSAAEQAQQHISG